MSHFLSSCWQRQIYRETDRQRRAGRQGRQTQTQRHRNSDRETDGPRRETEAGLTDQSITLSHHVHHTQGFTRLPATNRPQRKAGCVALSQTGGLQAVNSSERATQANQRSGVTLSPDSVTLLKHHCKQRQQQQKHVTASSTSTSTVVKRMHEAVVGDRDQNEIFFFSLCIVNEKLGR